MKTQTCLIPALLALGSMASIQDVYAQVAPESCLYLTPAADNHTCQHGRLGPYASVGSSPHPDDTATFNVNIPHTLYTVTLSGEVGDNRSALGYTPAVSGDFAFYLNQDYPLEVLDAEGQPVSLRLQNDIPACPEYLGWFHVYEQLKSGHSYTVVLGPHDETFVQIVIEHLGAFPGMLYEDADGDTFGRRDSAVQSWCGSAIGYTSTFGDCSDDDPTVFPGAEEACNGIDDDCDGEIDEMGDALCGADARCMGHEGCVVLPGDDCGAEGCGGTPGGGDPVEVDPCPTAECKSEPDGKGVEGSGGDSGSSGMGSGATSSASPQGGHDGGALAGEGGEGPELQPDPDDLAAPDHSRAGCSCRHARGSGSSALWLACSLFVVGGLRRRQGVRTQACTQGRSDGQAP